ncbi:MAG: hypothetical protein JWO38_6808 [Gemmataceae bacterium]|nr:hypothetical protein [Gemmataceae bacterium]
MRAVSLAVAAVFVFVLPGWANAQIPIPPLPPEPIVPASTPLTLPSADPGQEAGPGHLAGGTEISRPLQPVATPQPPPTTGPRTTGEIRPTVDDRDPKPGKVLGDWWDTDELLIWWPKAAPVPPLVTGSRGGSPLLGQPQTTLLVGHRSIDTQDVAGYRLTHGWSLNKDDTVGFEGRYFFLGTRTLSEFVTDLGNGRFRTIGLPYQNALTGRPDVLSVASPGLSSALVTVSTSSRVQGAEANLVGNLYAGPGVKLHALAGYRFFQVNEGLRVEQTWLQYPTATSAYYQTLGMVADQFDAHNEFHGGQLGLMADLHRGMFFVEMTGKAALGTNYQVVTIDGATHLITAANPIPLMQSFPGGVYALPSNMGRVKHTVFAVVPEATFKVGLKLGDRARFFVGYNFLYLSNAVRPGDQIDRTLNPSQIPLLARGGPILGPDRPQATVKHTDFWVQGLVIGLEGRF